MEAPRQGVDYAASLDLKDNSVPLFLLSSERVGQSPVY